ncbi:SurA N-terminal domain-containing protein [Eionea flava]
MLQAMRNKTKGLVAVFLIGLLTIPLALVGVENLFYGSSHVGEAAEVDGVVITERDVQLAIARERQRLQSQFGDSFPAAFFTDERLRESAMSSLIQRSLMVSSAKEGNMTFSEKEVDQAILEQPIFQLEGTFNQQQFLQSVRNLGHTPTSFRELLKSDLLANQLQTAVVSSDFVTDQEINQAVSLSRQTRDFSWITLPLGDLPASISVSDDEVVSHYDSNKQDYLSTEEIAIEYIDINIDEISKDITIDDAAIQQQYDAIVASYQSSTQREAAHIMVEGSDDTAVQKIAEIQEKLAAGGDFSALASEYSDDFGTRDNGGSLGVSTGDAFPEAFEETLLSLSAGEVSKPVEIDGATHFIKLVSIEENSAPTFESQRAKILSDLQRSQAEEQFIQDVQTLEDLAYNAENLSEVANEIGIEARKTTLFSRETASSTDPVLQDVRIVEAAFSNDVVREGHSSEVINLSSDRAVVIKLIDHKPVRTLTLDEKRQSIIEELQLEKAKAQVAEQARTLRVAIDSGVTITDVAETESVTVETQTDAQRNTAGVPEDLLAKVFEMPYPAESEVSILETHLDSGDYVIVSLSKVTPGDTENLTDAERESLRTSLSSGISNDEYRAWLAALEANADVDIYRSQNAATY